MSKHDIYCLNCDGDGYIVTGSGKTKWCTVCDGTGLTEAGLQSLEKHAKEVDSETTKQLK